VAERVLDGEDDLAGRPPPRVARGDDVDDAQPHEVAARGRPRGAAVGQQPRQPLVDGSAGHPQRGHEVGLAQVAPQPRLGLRRRRHELLDGERGVGPLPGGPARLGHERRVGERGPGVVVDGHEAPVAAPRSTSSHVSHQGARRSIAPGVARRWAS
jgi:hypothetical protein